MTKFDAVRFLLFQRDLGKPIRDHQRRAFIDMCYGNEFKHGDVKRDFTSRKTLGLN